MTALEANSVTEDYVGLARYLAEAIELGEISFDEATTELGVTARAEERASLERAATTVSKTEDRSLVARLLARAQALRS